MKNSEYHVKIQKQNRDPQILGSCANSCIISFKEAKYKNGTPNLFVYGTAPNGVTSG